jgi:hypothetical protein
LSFIYVAHKNTTKGAFPPSHFCNKLDDKLAHNQKAPYKQMSHIFVLFVSQKLVANQIGLLQTHQGNFASKFVIKFVAKM